VTAASFVGARAAARRAAGGWVLAAAVVVLAGDSGAAQPPAKAEASPPEELFRDMRGLVRDGKFDLAAVYLRAFVASDPTEPLLLKIEKDYGTTVFQDLRAVPWSDDRKTNDLAKADVETLITKARAAVAKQLETPDRVNKYIRNLGATEEEREFAELELKRTGDYAVPYMVDALRRSSSPQLTRGILGAIPKQDAATMGGWLAALDGFTPDMQYAVLAAIGRRPDVLDLTKAAQTDFTPRLWYAYGKPDTLPGLRDFAKSALERMVRDVERRSPAEELVALARPFANHKATYGGALSPATGAPATVAVWEWNAKDEKLVKQPTVPTPQADEFFGLRYAKWALDVRPDYDVAQGLVLALAAETAIERGKFGDLARTDPTVYKLLADAPSQVLNDQLDRAFAENRSALVLALVQVLGDRADRAAATGAPNRPSRLERGLSYPNPRVQFASANALLRSPVPLDGKTRGRVMEVLRREAAGDPGVPSGAKGQALLADPDRKRADDTAVLLRQIGYDVEVFGTGRDVLRRVARASDFDLIVIDRHVPNPELRDLIGHLRADANAARRPVLVVASSDQPIPPSFDQMLLRFGLLIAATETTQVGMPDPYVADIRRSPEADIAERKAIQDRRDAVFASTQKTRADRLTRVLETSGIELSPDQKFQVKLRVDQVTWAVLAAEFPLTKASAPGAYQQYETLFKQIAVQPSVPEYTRRLGLDHLMSLLARFEQDVAGAPGAQTRFEAFRARVDADALGLVVRPPRDYVAEARTQRLVGQYPGLRVIPEPYSKTWFEMDVNAAFQDPADRPRDPAEKRATARQAVQWLARMATGEVPGFDARLASAELLAALRTDELAEVAVDGVARIPSMEAQVGLVGLAVTPMRPLQLRVRAADAAVRHVQAYGKLTPEALTATVTRSWPHVVRGRAGRASASAGHSAPLLLVRSASRTCVPDPTSPPREWILIDEFADSTTYVAKV